MDITSCRSCKIWVGFSLWPITSASRRLFVQQLIYDNNIKGLSYRPFVRVSGRFPSQRSSIVESRFISWHHHVIGLILCGMLSSRMSVIICRQFIRHLYIKMKTFELDVKIVLHFLSIVSLSYAYYAIKISHIPVYLEIFPSILWNTFWIRMF